MAAGPAESEVTDGHRGGRRTSKDTKLEGDTRDRTETWQKNVKLRRIIAAPPTRCTDFITEDT